MGNTIFVNRMHRSSDRSNDRSNDRSSDKKVITIKEYPIYCKGRVKRDPSFLDNNATGICSIW